MEKKIAFFDIDGTLISSNGNEVIMPESTKVAIREFRKRGNLAFVCSGRPIRFIIQEFGEDMFDGYIAGNGTHIVHEGKDVYHRLIDVDTVKQLQKSFDELGISCCFNGLHEGYAYNMPIERVEEYNSMFTGEPYLLKEWDIDNIKVNTLDIFYSKEECLNKCIEYFKDKLVFNSHGPHMSADVSFKDWGKSHAIEHFIQLVGMNMEDTFAFGDGYNDIEMIKTVKTGIAMGNAVEALKKEANYVTSSILEDGIYNAMKEFGLI
ncbi:HAD family hydrolase [Clostridium fungisolvens]|uniref:Bifunctional phosphatase/peptidyl-prolyl cis-trans isomerase n=1 Tax=Clostridium fungisolvens TaxID=1604897 RepID=A0A6V8SDT7_9CLOT|nr:HAD family hydrolase [Clostridium fungisolvens]GFP74712.1 Putative bifunctional phosphatase/peptidyl-prolyl cis-trans isomerase [Clostridium fungisolvens]